MYRPTVRYDDEFHDYVEDVFHSTSLDRNEIIKLALFTAAHTKEFNNILEVHRDVSTSTSLPSPSWELYDTALWRNAKRWREEEEELESEDVSSEESTEHIERKTIAHYIDGKEVERKVTTNEIIDRHSERSSREVQVVREGGGFVIRL